MLSASEIHDILVERIDVQQQSVGMVVGVIDPAGRRVVAYGALDQGDPRVLGGDTVFEIGSVSKVFTSLLLADMIERGEAALNEPLAAFVPDGVRVPARGGRQITLQDLANHTSALPRLPSNLMPEDATNPYADYSAERLYGFLSSFELSRDIGEKYEYSNLGSGLLGQALTRRAGMSYENLVAKRIAEPLGLNSTAVTLTADMRARLAVGHNSQLQAVCNWDFDALAGAGALRSTANDLLTFLAANLDLSHSHLGPAMKDQLAVRWPTGTKDLEIALGWHIHTQFGAEVVWHDGGTYGYCSFVGFDPKARHGVVVLSNALSMTGAEIGIADIGLHILNAQFQLHTPQSPQERREISLEERALNRYIGQYELASNFILSITQENGHLYAKATGQPQCEIFAETETSFFYKIADIRIDFESDGNGKVHSLVLHQSGRDVSARRME